MKTHKLENGITVILDKRDNFNNVAVFVGVSVGSLSEEKNEEGLAHFFEHMCFKGTKNRDVTKLLFELDFLGLNYNAFTSYDSTVYYVLGNKNKTREMIDITGDMFLNSTFPADELEKEKGVIVSEINMYENLNKSSSYQMAMKNLYKTTRAEHSILGKAEDVKSYTREDFINFMEKHYTPENTIISIAGAFNEDEVLAQITELYGGIENKKETSYGDISISQVDSKHNVLVKKEGNECAITILFDIGDLKDIYPLEAFVNILGRGFSSRLVKRIREEMGACYYIGSRIDYSKGLSYLNILTGIEPDRAEEVIKAIADELTKIKNEEVSEKELEKSKNSIIGELSIKEDDMDGVATNNFGEYVVFGKPISFKEVADGISAVSVKDIKTIANKALDPKRMSVSYVSSKDVPEAVSRPLFEL